MIGGKNYYFFRLERFDGSMDYRIAESVEDLHLRFGDSYMRCFTNIVNVGEVTIEHIRAIDSFLLQSIS